MAIGDNGPVPEQSIDAARSPYRLHFPRNFFEQFHCERSTFIAQIQGIDDAADRERYASLLLTRIMYLYFLRSQGMVNDSASHIAQRLENIRQGNRFNDTPLLNLSLFSPHAIESENPSIRFPHDAIGHMCAFFDHYIWQIDEDSPCTHHTLTPVVLSYLCERQTNQKMLGAYYTREDITAYIATFTIIPYLLRSVEQDAMYPVGLPWHLLRSSPQRYIYPALAHGQHLSLPEAIAAGISDVSRRTGWDAFAPALLALPNETWREVVARHQRYTALLAMLRADELNTIDALITENIDIYRFALDIIESCQDNGVLRAFSDIMRQMTILDPTCGTGAFLLAALNVLEPLYMACYQRLTQLQARPTATNTLADNQVFAIRQTILASNLYGVDIMEEAVALCQARLYLKLLASAGQGYDMQALPDLNFHIRAGNILTDSSKKGQRWSVILGNPPFLEYEKVSERYQLEGYTTRSTGNVYAMTVERCMGLLQTSGRLGMIVPASATGSHGYRPLQQLLLDQSLLHIASFSDQRGKLFPIPHPRLCILLFRKTTGQSAVYTTTYLKTGRRERPALFQRLGYCNASSQVMPGIIPRYGSHIECGIHAKLYGQSHCLSDYAVKHSEHPIYFTRKLSWFVQVTPFIPAIFDEVGAKRFPSELKTVYFTSAVHRDIALIALNSHLFYWFITTRSDCRNLNMRDILGFPLVIEDMPVHLQRAAGELAKALGTDLQAHAELRTMHFRKHGTLTIQCMFPGKSIVILDSIDRLLAEAYAFTGEELDFLLHFDRKFRVC